MPVGLLSRTYFINVFKSPLFSMIVFAVAGAVIGHSIGMLTAGAEEHKKYLAKAAAVLGAVAGLSLSTIGTVYDLARNWAFLLFMSALIASFLWHYLDGILEHRHRKYTGPSAVLLAMMIWFAFSRLSHGRSLEEAAGMMLTMFLVGGIGAVFILVIWLAKKFKPVNVPREVGRRTRELARAESDTDTHFTEATSINRELVRAGEAARTQCAGIERVAERTANEVDTVVPQIRQQCQELISAAGRQDVAEQRRILNDLLPTVYRTANFLLSETERLKSDIENFKNRTDSFLGRLNASKERQDKLGADFQSLSKRIGSVHDSLPESSASERDELAGIQSETEDIRQTLVTQIREIVEHLTKLSSSTPASEQRRLELSLTKIVGCNSRIQGLIENLRALVPAESGAGPEVNYTEVYRKIVEIGQTFAEITSELEVARSTLSETANTLGTINKHIKKVDDYANSAYQKYGKIKGRLNAIISIVLAERTAAEQERTILTNVRAGLDAITSLVTRFENLSPYIASARRPQEREMIIESAKATLVELDQVRQRLLSEIRNISTFGEEHPKRARALNFAGIKQGLTAAFADNGALQVDFSRLSAEVAKPSPDLNEVQRIIAEIASHRGGLSATVDLVNTALRTAR